MKHRTFAASNFLTAKNIYMNQNKSKSIIEASVVMTEMQGAIYEVEAFLGENYLFRRNLLNGKVEMSKAKVVDDKSREWTPVTTLLVNSIVRHAKSDPGE